MADEPAVHPCDCVDEGIFLGSGSHLLRTYACGFRACVAITEEEEYALHAGRSIGALEVKAALRARADHLHTQDTGHR